MNWNLEKQNSQNKMSLETEINELTTESILDYITYLSVPSGLTSITFLPYSLFSGTARYITTVTGVVYISGITIHILSTIGEVLEYSLDVVYQAWEPYNLYYQELFEEQNLYGLSQDILY